MSDLTFTYTITGFDEAKRILTVEIDGEGRRDIGLVGQPTTIEDIETQVRPWATHAELIEARQTPHDFSFVNGFIGTSREIDRFRRTPIAAPVVQPTDEPNSEGMAAEEKAFVESILREHGLIQ